MFESSFRSPHITIQIPESIIPELASLCAHVGADFRMAKACHFLLRCAIALGLQCARKAARPSQQNSTPYMVAYVCHPYTAGVSLHATVRLQPRKSVKLV